jgi:hypothetical protein
MMSMQPNPSTSHKDTPVDLEDLGKLVQQGCSSSA